MSNNPPAVVLNLTLEEGEFLLDNCDSNIAFALEALPTLETRSAQEALVTMLEKFRAIRNKLRVEIPL